MNFNTNFFLNNEPDNRFAGNLSSHLFFFFFDSQNKIAGGNVIQ